MGFGMMVIMESGSQWPAWLDRKGPTPTSIELVTQQTTESLAQFARRAVQRLLELDEAPSTGVLVCNGQSGGERMALRGTLLRALVGRASSAGQGQVVLAADGDYAQRRDLLGLAARLNEEIEDDMGVVVRFRALAREPRESWRVRRVA
jgi:hypothetical protein